MDSAGGIRRKKFKNVLSFVRTQIISNDVDLALGGLHLTSSTVDLVVEQRFCASDQIT